MGLADRLAEQPQKKVNCRTCQYLDSLEQKDQSALLDALADTTYSTPRIWQAMRSEGFTAGVGSVKAHRASKECSNREPSRSIERSTKTRSRR